MTNEFRKWMSNSFLERSVNDAHGAERLTETGEMNG